MGRVNPGDLVRFLDDVGEGRVVRVISESMAEVETSDGWVLPVHIKNLVVIPQNNPSPKPPQPVMDQSNMTVIVHEKEVKNAILNTPPLAKPAKTKQPPREIDLHINKITESVVGLTNTEILSIQMDVFRRELNRSIRDNESEIIFIHGIGNGTLKGELRRAIDRDFSWCTQEDASFREYGFGATRVRIPQNKPPFY